MAVLGTVRYGLAVEAPAATDLAPGIVLAFLGGVLMIVVASGPVEELLDLQ